MAERFPKKVVCALKAPWRSDFCPKCVKLGGGRQESRWEPAGDGGGDAARQGLRGGWRGTRAERGGKKKKFFLKKQKFPAALRWRGGGAGSAVHGCVGKFENLPAAVTGSSFGRRASFWEP